MLTVVVVMVWSDYEPMPHDDGKASGSATA
ncbi:hypothetical protein MexAM1_META1p2062 [Methylorubrum extorquens AM1]|jgi:hypothetical protein|uniref:Uncharacterized protein n=1 Tax=Methylorubrum extorquens (strain ATCC 14718 / DSM 1338 / JCM 2805 / NCIMB 9133 / AM1) TaxID=272630 RepID=C5B2K8_METEA|nr:hypothetical protein MexAM1_META1p2062 [Methylorubrum extorquens AM1]